MKKSILIVTVLVCAVSGIFMFMRNVNFKQSCGGHLERAAMANSVEIAQKELKVAIDYLETEGLTHGSTHVFYATPDNDIAFWYGNLKSAYTELSHIPVTSSLQERTNVLMKLRESLIEHGKDSESVIAPPRISLYPYQWLYVLMVLSAVVGFFNLQSSKAKK